MTLYRWYHVFRQAGFEVGWLSCDTLATGQAHLPPTDSLVVLPSLYMLSQENAARLADWTRAGGRLLVVAGAASRCPSTFVNEQPPGQALADLLGLVELPYRWWDPARARLGLRIVSDTLTDPVWPLAVARVLPGDPPDILARWPDDAPALLGRRTGSGKAAWLGAALDVDDAATTAAAEQLIPILLQWLDLQPQIPIAGPAWRAGWLNRRYEVRLAVHPRQGQFLWIFARRGDTVWSGRQPDDALDWLSGRQIISDVVVDSYRITCMSAETSIGKPSPFE